VVQELEEVVYKAEKNIAYEDRRRTGYLRGKVGGTYELSDEKNIKIRKNTLP